MPRTTEKYNPQVLEIRALRSMLSWSSGSRADPGACDLDHVFGHDHGPEARLHFDQCAAYPGPGACRRPAACQAAGRWKASVATVAGGMRAVDFSFK